MDFTDDDVKSCEAAKWKAILQQSYGMVKISVTYIDENNKERVLICDLICRYEGELLLTQKILLIIGIGLYS